MGVYLILAKIIIISYKKPFRGLNIG